MIDRFLLYTNQGKQWLSLIEIYQSRIVEDWRKLTWSDECSVKKNDDSRRDYKIFDIKIIKKNTRQKTHEVKLETAMCCR